MPKIKLDNYELIQTADGSSTVYSKIYGEAAHSTSGARKETCLHYIQGCQIVKKAAEKKIAIFETGFGVGLGLEETKKALNKQFFTFISTEIDDDLIQYVLQNNNIYQGVEKKNGPCPYYELTNEHFRLIILQGNARETLPKLRQISHMENMQFDCIYQDAFSPKKNAILWTTQWFELLKSYAHPECIMSTYSSSSSIRKSMIAAGWKLYHGEKFGPKRSSTRARLFGATEEQILLHLQRSPSITLTDQNYKDYTLENTK